jgi:hypothetical protein
MSDEVEAAWEKDGICLTIICQILQEINEEFECQEIANARKDISQVNLMGRGLDEGPQDLTTLLEEGASVALGDTETTYNRGDSGMLSLVVNPAQQALNQALLQTTIDAEHATPTTAHATSSLVHSLPVVVWTSQSQGPNIFSMPMQLQGFECSSMVTDSYSLVGDP